MGHHEKHSRKYSKKSFLYLAEVKMIIIIIKNKKMKCQSESKIKTGFCSTQERKSGHGHKALCGAMSRL